MDPESSTQEKNGAAEGHILQFNHILQVTTSTVGDGSRVLNAREETDPKRKRRMGLQGLSRALF